jgi:PIN domain nuclease of toxin-antitoxin system
VAKIFAYISAMKTANIGDLKDGIITATACLKDGTILTADENILAYPHVKSVW